MTQVYNRAHKRVVKFDLKSFVQGGLIILANAIVIAWAVSKQL